MKPVVHAEVNRVKYSTHTCAVYRSDDNKVTAVLHEKASTYWMSYLMMQYYTAQSLKRIQNIELTCLFLHTIRHHLSRHIEEMCSKRLPLG